MLYTQHMDSMATSIPHLKQFPTSPAPASEAVSITPKEEGDKHQDDEQPGEDECDDNSAENHN